MVEIWLNVANCSVARLRIPLFAARIWLSA